MKDKLQQMPFWSKAVMSFIPILGTAFVIIPPYIGLPDTVAAHADSLRTHGKSIEHGEENDNEILCLLLLTFEEDAPTPQEIIDCGESGR